ncbi:23S rRNA methyltransferase attenuation leader peptide, partial [Streptococcus suis]
MLVFKMRYVDKTSTV